MPGGWAAEVLVSGSDGIGEPAEQLLDDLRGAPGMFGKRRGRRERRQGEPPGRLPSETAEEGRPRAMVKLRPPTALRPKWFSWMPAAMANPLRDLPSGGGTTANGSGERSQFATSTAAPWRIVASCSALRVFLDRAC